MSSRLKDLNPNEFKPIKKKDNPFDLSELDRVWPAVVEFENKKDEFEDFFSEFDTLDEFGNEFNLEWPEFDEAFSRPWKEWKKAVDLAFSEFDFEELSL